MLAIINNRPGRCDLCGLLTLEAGRNLLDTKEKVDAWEKVKDIPDIKSRLEPSKRFPGGELREENVDTPRKRRALVPNTVSIEGLNRKESILAVEATDDVSTLLTFMDQTKDGVTKKVIREKIEDINSDEDPEDDETDEDEDSENDNEDTEDDEE